MSKVAVPRLRAQRGARIDNAAGLERGDGRAEVGRRSGGVAAVVLVLLLLSRARSP